MPEPATPPRLRRGHLDRTWCRRRGGAGAGDASGAHDPHTSAVHGDKRTIVCASCGHSVTRAAERIEISGRHHHTCVNPGGHVFHIVCFRRAPGCVGQSGWTTYFSWFAGHAWQVAGCSACLTQLGWGFRGEGSAFFGLIADRIAER